VVLEAFREWLGATRVRVPTVLQMEAVECGAACLGSVLAYHGCYIPLETLRIECGVGRDGANAANIVRAARKFGLDAEGYQLETEELGELPLPLILHWKLNHFVVLEGIGKKRMYLNDPAMGPTSVSAAEFDGAFTGVALALEPGESFQRLGRAWSPTGALKKRLQGSRLALFYLVLAGLGLVLPGLVVPSFSRIFIDDILVGRKDSWLFPLFVAMANTALVIGGLGALQRRYLLRLESKLALSASSQFLWHTLRLPMRFYLQRNPAELASRTAINDSVARLLGGRLASTAIAVVMVVLYLALMLQYDLFLTAIGVLAIAINLAALRISSRTLSDAGRRLAQEGGRLGAVAMTGLSVIETVKASAQEDDFFRRWSGQYANAANARQQLDVADQLMAALPTLLSALSGAFVLWIGGRRVIDAELSMGMLVAFQSLMAGLLGPASELLRMGTDVQQLEGDMRRLDDVLVHELDPATAALGRRPAVAATGDEPPAAKLIGRVELKGVSFGYSPLLPPLIEGLDLLLRPGSRVALVGGSGSGKSTIARLVSGLYEPWAGSIEFDGRPRGKHRREVVTNSMSVVDQDICLFEGTVLENLTLWDATVPEAQVVRAARDACIHDAIVARQGSYESKIEEGGRNFSGGQRQRLEIARALVLNPSILILDEATSALDPATETQLDENLRRRGCTCLIVAHRLSTIRDADEIVVLEKGRVVERGTHRALHGQSGIYSRLIGAEAS
jgi:NHLM bacteriocin system ABC transporter peptidase/ATP-binding protein